jgi:hypothetical protein
MADGYGSLLWGTPARRMITVLTLVAAVAGVTTAVPPAWDAAGLPEFATRFYVHAEVDPIKVAQADTTKAVNQLLLTQLQSALYAAQMDAAKAPSQTVTDRINDLQSQIAATQAKLSAAH